MTDVYSGQFPDDERQVVRSANADGSLNFQQVGFDELDFGAVFGGKTTSTTENACALGIKSWTLDTDDGKIKVGHTVQIISLDDPDCFMYGVVTATATTPSPLTITVAVHTVSALTGTFSNWEVQIVEVSRDITVEVGDADFTAEDYHRVIFYTTPLTAPRTLTLSAGTTLIPGQRTVVVDAGANFTSTNYLLIDGEFRLFISGAYHEFIWDGGQWVAYEQRGFLWGSEAGSIPQFIVEYENSATLGPYIWLWKSSDTPAANDGIGAVAHVGNNSAAEAVTYAMTYADILDPTDGSEDGKYNISTIVAGTAAARFSVGSGLWGSGATGGDQGAGTGNFTNLFVNGTNISASYAANAFKTISVSGQSDVVADSPTDTLTLVAGTNVTITTNATTDTVTITADESAASILTKIKTVDGAGSGLDADLLDGLNSAVLPQLLATGNASGATLDLTSAGGAAVWSGFSKIVIELINLIPATDNVQLLGRVSTDGGSSYDAAANSYFYTITALSSTENGTVQRSETATSFLHATALATANGIGNGAAEGISLTLELTDPGNTAIKQKMVSRGAYYSANDHAVYFNGICIRNAVQDTDAFRFLFSAGNISSGKYRVWGFK